MASILKHSFSYIIIHLLFTEISRALPISPLVTTDSFRWWGHYLSAIACELDLDVCHFDVEQAFVQSKLDEDVFLRLPRGCGRLSGNKVVRLNKSLDGLKQASWSWHTHLTTCLKTLGFQQCLADACVFRLVE